MTSLSQKAMAPIMAERERRARNLPPEWADVVVICEARRERITHARHNGAVYRLEHWDGAFWRVAKRVTWLPDVFGVKPRAGFWQFVASRFRRCPRVAFEAHKLEKRETFVRGWPT